MITTWQTKLSFEIIVLRNVFAKKERSSVQFSLVKVERLAAAIENGRIACVPTGRGICRVTMGSQYHTFDERDFTYIEDCKYRLALAHKINSTDPRWFSVQATNKDHGTNTRVSRLHYVTVELPDNVVKMHQYSTTLNGETIHGYHSALFKIRLTGRSVYLMTQHGLLLTVDKDRITIQLPSSYTNETHGLCGNLNQNPDDDFETELNILAFDLNKFARSYLVGDCTRKDPAPPRSECPDLESQKWSGSQYCGLLTNPSGVFAPCHKTVDPEHYFQSCVFNLCATDVETLLLEKVLKNYAAVCQEHDVALCDWRNKTSTVRLNCSSNSHYVGCASPCPDTCSDPFASADCPLPGYVEDCVCNVGYVRDGDYCVRKSDCGKITDGKYFSRLCEEPPKIQNGISDYGNTPHPYFVNERVYYSCDKNFQMTRAITGSGYTCGADGKWNLTDPYAPECKRVCEDPPGISHGYPDGPDYRYPYWDYDTLEADYTFTYPFLWAIRQFTNASKILFWLVKTQPVCAELTEVGVCQHRNCPNATRHVRLLHLLTARGS